MKKYILLLRGINVGGKNKLPMNELKDHLMDMGLVDVSTYIQSGNVFLKSSLEPNEIEKTIEASLPNKFKLDSSIIKTLVLRESDIKEIINHKPKDFGDEPDKYHYDVIFLIDTSVDEAITAFNPREEIDVIYKGKSVIYSKRLSSMRNKSRLSRIAISPLYKSMTMRNWNTTKKLGEMIN